MIKKSHIPKGVSRGRKGKPPIATQFKAGNQAAKDQGRPREKDLMKLMHSFFSMGIEGYEDETLIERRIRLLHDIFEEATGRDSITLERKKFWVFTKSGDKVEVEKRPNPRLLIYAHQMAFGKIPDVIDFKQTDQMAERLHIIANGPNGNQELQHIIDQVIALANKSVNESSY